MGIGNALPVWLAKEATGRRAMSHPHARFSADWYGGREERSVQRGAKKCFPCLKLSPNFCQAKWPAHAQPFGPDGTCVTQLSSINFA